MASRTRSNRSSTATASRRSQLMRISRRVVNSKRHTQGYIINGRFYNVNQATSLAKRGRVAGVRVVGNHIQAAIGRRPLQNLPTDVQNQANARRNRRRSS